MELFFDAVVEYKLLRETFKQTEEQCFQMIYSDSQSEQILTLFDTWKNQIYMLEIQTNNDGITKENFISPSLIICLNYIFQSKLIDSEWNIYNLRNV